MWVPHVETALGPTTTTNNTLHASTELWSLDHNSVNACSDSHNGISLLWIHMNLKAPQITGHSAGFFFVSFVSFCCFVLLLLIFNSMFKLTTKKSSNVHRVGPLWGESTGCHWIPTQRVSDIWKAFWCHHVYYITNRNRMSTVAVFHTETKAMEKFI